MSEALLAQLRAARTRKFTPTEGVEFTYMLPSQFRCGRLVQAMRAGDGDAITEELLPLLSGWSGITEATLLGAAVGSSKVAPHDAGVARILLADRPAWVTEWAMHAVSEATEAVAKLKEQAGN